MYKRTAVVLLTLLVLSLVVGCAAPTPAPTEEPMDTGGLPNLNGREVVAATTGDCPPWNAVDEDGNLTGMEVEMVEEICERINCEVTWRTVNFDGLIPGLVAGDFDVAVSNMTHTKAREEQVDFTEHYYRSGEVVVVREGETRIEDYRDLADSDLIVGSETGTICEVAAREEAGVPDDRLLLYEGLDTLFLALVNGDIDAVVDGAESAARYVAQYPDDLEIIGEAENRVFGGGPVGMAIAKDEPEIRDAFSAATIAMRDEGRINELLEKYGQQTLAPEDYEVEIPEGR